MRHLALLVVVSLLAACASSPPLTDHDPRADFSRLKTYAWLQADPVAATQSADDQVSPLNRQRIADAIERQLAAAGFTRAAADTTPDFLVSFAVGLRQRTEVSHYPESRWWFGYWSRPYGFGTDIDVRQVDEPRLSIDIYEGTSRKPVWHGQSRGRLPFEDPKRIEAAITPAVAAILGQFPPRK
ncbi:MAG: hypothetical protein RL026_1161 [Pseudomonadota bacterium]